MAAPRRTRGTGSVYYNEQRGRWQGEIPVVGPDGRTRSVTVTHRGPGPKAAGALAAKRAWEKKLEAKKAELAKAGGKKTNTVLTVGKVLEDWAATTLETSRRTGARAPKTCNDYANTIRLHSSPGSAGSGWPSFGSPTSTGWSGPCWRPVTSRTPSGSPGRSSAW